MNGLILLDKPAGITSFSAVSRVKRLLGERRVGHTGTLDPMATGVLPVLFGRATALSSFLLDSNKEYTAEIKLGITTDSDDITGNELKKSEVNVTDDQLWEVLKSFEGRIMQAPPAYSAIKKDGVRMYTLAREGRAEPVSQRPVEIFRIKLISGLDDRNVFKIETAVSKGTYIRALARDIGECLGCGGTLFSLRRTFAGGFDISLCTPLGKLSEENIGKHVLSEETAVSYLKKIEVSEKQAVRFCNGGPLSYDRVNLKNADIKENELIRVKYSDLFLGIGFADNEKQQIGVKCIINYPKGQNR